MHERILHQMREKIRTRQYVMTLHAEEEMDEDEFSIFDVESVILTGRIIERQKEGWTSPDLLRLREKKSVTSQLTCYA